MTKRMLAAKAIVATGVALSACSRTPENRVGFSEGNAASDSLNMAEGLAYENVTNAAMGNETNYSGPDEPPIIPPPPPPPPR